MKEIDGYGIGGVDYGKISKAFNNSSRFKNDDTYEGYFTEILKALESVKTEIVTASAATATTLGRGKVGTNLGYDHPTDVIWVISIVSALRTLAMLQSKANDKRRRPENREAHKRLVEEYVRLLRELISKKEEYASLYPYEELEE